MVGSVRYTKTLVSTSGAIFFNEGVRGVFLNCRSVTGTASAPRSYLIALSSDGLSMASAAQRSDRITFTVVSPSVIMRSFG